MSRLGKLPGISGENTSRRNLLVGSGYAVAVAGCFGLALSDPDDEDDPATAEAEPEHDTEEEAEPEDVDDEPEPDDDDDVDDEAAETEPGLLWEDHLDSDQTTVGLSPDGGLVVCALERDSLAIYEEGDRSDVELPVAGLMERITVLDSNEIFLDTGSGDVSACSRWMER